MDAKDQQASSGAGKEVNIDISGEPNDQSAIKSMSPVDTDSRVGLTKEELMKYANEPFWVRLRNILFASFWIIWASTLIAAWGYVFNSPGCMVVSAAAAAGATNATQAAAAALKSTA